MISDTVKISKGSFDTIALPSFEQWMKMEGRVVTLKVPQNGYPFDILMTEDEDLNNVFMSLCVDYPDAQPGPATTEFYLQLVLRGESYGIDGEIPRDKFNEFYSAPTIFKTAFILGNAVAFVIWANPGTLKLSDDMPAEKSVRAAAVAELDAIPAKSLMKACQCGCLPESSNTQAKSQACKHTHTLTDLSGNKVCRDCSAKLSTPVAPHTARPLAGIITSIAHAAGGVSSVGSVNLPPGPYSMSGINPVTLAPSDEEDELGDIMSTAKGVAMFDKINSTVGKDSTSFDEMEHHFKQGSTSVNTSEGANTLKMSSVARPTT